jgi:hypothetical protein
MSKKDEELLERVVRELQTLEAPLTMVLRPSTVFQLVGLLQLVLRRPDLDGPSATTARVFIEHVRGFFADSPAISELIRRGDDPRYDVPRGPRA